MAKKKVKKGTKHATVPKTTSKLSESVEDVITAALSAAPTATHTMLLKVCRLCETKDGPFLDIFDADKLTAKKVEDLMPFGISENDDLSHKICFRCSAKVEELHEFIQKCIKTQENLRKAMGKQGQLTMKSRSRVIWKKELNKKIVSNDDICDVLIKQAMEGIHLNAPLELQPPSSTKKPIMEPSKVTEESESESDEEDDAISLRQVKQAIEADEVPPPRASRSSRKPTVVATVEEPEPNTIKVKTHAKKPSTSEIKTPEPPKVQPAEVVEKKQESIVEKPKELSQPTKNDKKEEEEKPTKPFNIMDHVSTIKVNHVGVLFQCKLCNRNFLKKDIVMNHGCAKNHGPPKETSSTNAPTPGPPKPPTVQYIKMDNIKKPLSSVVDKTVEKLLEQPLPAKPADTVPEVKPKPKIGPASRVKAKLEPTVEPTPPKAPAAPEVPSLPPSVSFPAAPSLNSRYKLVPGPNNTFQLVEESTIPEETPVKQPETQSRKRHRDTSHSKPKHSKESLEKSSSPEVIDLDDNNESQPYPVGLFQPVPHHSSVSPVKPPVPFTTPAMKKQSYTIVQTGNPSKLLISTKPQPVEEPVKKKSKKKTELLEKELLKVTSEPVAASGEKDRGFFTFVSLNAADILTPSYVLPSNNIIQESQITTSSAIKPAAVERGSDSSYSCNMCGETFTREKKLLSHIQSHYNQMDAEDEQRTGKPGPKRRTRKS